jgi:starch-binding outer membrane protein, SusD/RagB family
MKKFIIIFLSISLSAGILTSCLKDYLDKAPASVLPDDQVFGIYTNFLKYFDGTYNGATTRFIRNGFTLFFNQTYWSITWESITDMTDQGALEECFVIKGGNMGGIINYFTYTNKAFWNSMWVSIRVCNMTLQNIGRLTDATQENTDDLIAQAHFVRAFAHLTLVKLWGGLPYITKVIGAEDQWDIPRLSRHETLLKIAADFDTAAMYYEKAGRMRRDPGPGQAGHLGSPDQFRPNGVAAKAFKSRALLWAASPLNNELGKTDWEAAAKASWEAIQIAQQYGYALLSAADYKRNYVYTTYSNEQLWGWSAGNLNYNTGSLTGLLNGVFASSKTGNSGEAPTQNTVDRFETKWGDPLTTQAERDAAAAAGHYNEQDPYANRDPRFYIDIIYNTAPIPGYTTAKIYYEYVGGVKQYSELLDQAYTGISHTGYYTNKRWGGQSVKNQGAVAYTDPIIRLGELYLNYAEAANEAYGPTTAAPGATMSAADAINYMRNGPNRWTPAQLAPVQAKFTTSTDAFRPRVKNERIVELCFEGQYFYDIRRWKDAPASYTGPVMGVDIEKVPVSATYPTGYKYTRGPLPANRQTHWKDAMYFWPHDISDVYKMKNFVPNETW